MFCAFFLLRRDFLSGAAWVATQARRMVSQLLSASRDITHVQHSTREGGQVNSACRWLWLLPAWTAASVDGFSWVTSVEDDDDV
jgi:hypothetical protein